jgi:hypothetical protein
MKQKLPLAVLLIALLVAASYFFISTRLNTPGNRDGSSVNGVGNYYECVSKGFPVEEIYPSVCYANGQTFVQDIGNEREKEDLIRIANPRPGQVVTSPLQITGEARGMWFFEADFPVYLLDVEGNQVAVGIATAEGEWMTEEFVNFSATIEFSAPSSKTGTLILSKSNASGLPELDDDLRVPVRFYE